MSNQTAAAPFYYRPHSEPENVLSLIDEVREKVLEGYKASPELYLLDDIDYMKNEEWTTKAYLKQENYNVRATAARYEAMLKWRAKHQLHLVNDHSFPIELHRAGIAFTYQPDRWGNVTIYFRASRYLPIGWLREAERKYAIQCYTKAAYLSRGKGLAIICDLTDAGFANLDLNNFYFFLETSLQYTPIEAVRYIVIYNPPRLLGWLVALVRAAFPSHLLDKLQVAKGEEIFDYVSRENAPPYLGGTCPINYCTPPEGCVSWWEKPHWDVCPGLTRQQMEQIFEIYQPAIDEGAAEEKKYFGCQ